MSCGKYPFMKPMGHIKMITFRKTPFLAVACLQVLLSITFQIETQREFSYIGKYNYVFIKTIHQP